MAEVDQKMSVMKMGLATLMQRLPPAVARPPAPYPMSIPSRRPFAITADTPVELASA